MLGSHSLTVLQVSPVEVAGGLRDDSLCDFPEGLVSQRHLVEELGRLRGVKERPRTASVTEQAPRGGEERAYLADTVRLAALGSEHNALLSRLNANRLRVRKARVLEGVDTRQVVRLQGQMHASLAHLCATTDLTLNEMARGVLHQSPDHVS